LTVLCRNTSVLTILAVTRLSKLLMLSIIVGITAAVVALVG